MKTRRQSRRLLPLNRCLGEVAVVVPSIARLLLLNQCLLLRNRCRARTVDDHHACIMISICLSLNIALEECCVVSLPGCNKGTLTGAAHACTLKDARCMHPNGCRWMACSPPTLHTPFSLPACHPVHPHRPIRVYCLLLVGLRTGCPSCMVCASL